MARLKSQISANRRIHDSFEPISSTEYSDIYSPEDKAERARLTKENESLTQKLAQLPWSVASDRERILADRVMLAARVLGVQTSLSAATAEAVGENLRSAVAFISRFGRPTSQVKMLWAWREASSLIPIEAIRLPTRSTVSWVRDQAVLMLASFARGRQQNAGSYAEELGYDFVRLNLVARAKTYAKAAEGNVGRLALLLWALACYLSYGAASIFVNFATSWYVTTAPSAHLLFEAEFPINGVKTSWLVVAAPTILTFLLIPLFSRDIVRRHVWLTGIWCAAVNILVETKFPDAILDGFFGSRYLPFVATPLMVVVGCNFVFFLAAFAAALLPTVAAAGWRAQGKRVIELVRERQVVAEGITLAAAACAVLLWMASPTITLAANRIGIIYLIYFFIYLFFYGVTVLFIGFGIVVFGVMLLALLFWAWESARNDWRKTVYYISVSVSVIAVIITFVVAMLVISPVINPYLEIFFNALLLLCFLGLVSAIVLVLLRLWTLRSYGLLRYLFGKYASREKRPSMPGSNSLKLETVIRKWFCLRLCFGRR
jgi:hypothetical protein